MKKAGRTQRGIKSYTTRRTPSNADENTTSSMASPAPPTAANAASVSLSPDLQILRSVLMADMKEMIGNMFDKTLSTLNKSLGDIKLSVGDHEARIADLEQGLSEYSDRSVVLEALCERLLKENESFVERMEDAENRSRRFNLRVTNIVEKSPDEMNNPVKFMSAFFKEVLGDSVYPTAPVLDIAHRIGKERTGPSAKPRVMIVRFHYFQDKARALQADRNQLKWRGQKVLFFPDYAAATAKLRASFSKVKSLLFAKKVRFRLVFPAVLKVEFKNRNLVFKTAADAMKFYNQHVAGFAASTEGGGAADSDGTGSTVGPEGRASAAGVGGEVVTTGGEVDDDVPTVMDDSDDAASSVGGDDNVDTGGEDSSGTGHQDSTRPGDEEAPAED